MLLNDLKIAFRNLRWNKTFSTINILGLSLSMTTTLLILLWVKSERSFDSYHRQSGRIYQAVSHIKISDTETWHWLSTPLRLADEAQKEIPEIEAIVRLRQGSGYDVFEVGGRLFKEPHYAYVESGWFDLFDYEFVEGDAQTALQQTSDLVLTESKAAQLFGKRSALGQTIRIDSTHFVVKAIVRDNPANSSFQFDYLMPLTAYLARPQNQADSESWGNFNFRAYILVNEKADPTQTGQKLTSVLRNHKENDTTSYLSLESLLSIHFDPAFASEGHSGNLNLVRFLTAIGLLILLIACINYVSLTTAKASMRAKEVSVKKIIGAGRTALFRQFMTESALTSLLSLGIAIGLAQPGLHFFNQLMDTNLQMPLNDGTLALVLGGIALGTILLTGIYPALMLASLKPVKLLKGTSWASGKNAAFRKGLVVMQFFVTTTLIISAMVIYAQLQFVRSKDLGYQKEHVFSISVPWQAFGGARTESFSAAMNSLKRELLAESSIRGVTRSSASIVYNESSSSGNLEWTGRNPDFNPTVTPFSVDPDFQQVFGLSMQEGRWFEPGNTADERNLILNETAIKTMQLTPPYVGQKISFQGEEGQIIGVVKDFHFRSLHEPIAPVVLCNRKDWGLSLFIKTTAEQTTQALKATEAIWQRFLPEQPFSYTFEDETFETLYQADQRTAQLLAIFAGIAIFISCLGLFGMATFAAERRTKEIGIRKVLGASIHEINTLLTRDFLALVLVAICVAIPVAHYFMQQWLQDFAYRIELHWSIFALASLVAITIAFITVSTQSIRAALANPVESLRDE